MKKKIIPTKKKCTSKPKGGIKEIKVSKLSEERIDEILSQMSDMDMIGTIMGDYGDMKPNKMYDGLYIDNNGMIFTVPKKIKITFDENGKGIIKGLKPIRK